MEISIPQSAVFTGAELPIQIQQVETLALVINHTTTEYRMLDGWPEPYRTEQRKATAQKLLSVTEQLHALAAEFADSGSQSPEQDSAKP